MYRTVETPFRARKSSLVSVAGYAGAAIVAIASVSFIANRQEGWPWRLSPEAREVADLQRFGFWPFRYNILIINIFPVFLRSYAQS
jgi:hypothetical protein